MEIKEEIKSNKPRRNRADGTRRNVTYQRYNKPPYSYLGMIVVAIETSPDRKITLGGIHNALKDMFPFFNGQYLGWRDSVRHNLSHNACFYKVIRDNKNTMHPKGNYWKVDLASISEEDFQRQSSRTVCTETWCKTLQQQLRLPPFSFYPKAASITSHTHKEPPRPSKVKKGLKNFKIDTILKTEVKDDQKSALCKSEIDLPRLYEEKKNCFFTGIVFRDNPQLVAMLTDAARQCHGNQNSAIENLRSLCPPANYGTPPTLHRTWSTQPISPRVLSTNVFPQPFKHGVKLDHIVQGTTEPMDLSGNNMGSPGFCIPLKEISGGSFDHNKAVTCHLPQNQTSSPLQHVTTNSRRHLASNSNISEFSMFSSDVSGVYHDQSVTRQMCPVPLTSAYSQEHTTYICANNSLQSSPYHTMFSPMSVSAEDEYTRSMFSNNSSQSSPCHTVLSPMSVSVDHSRSSFTCQSNMSAGNASPVSSFASLQDMTSDSTSQMSDDIHVYHEPNGMFMRSVENSTSSDVTLYSVSNTQNLDMLATWALSSNEKSIIAETFEQL